MSVRYRLLLIAAFTLAEAANAQAPDTEAHSFNGNLSLVSDYRFRGLSQTDRRPAIQGGFDYAHASGFYLGNWNSSVDSETYPHGAGLEMDLYGGWKTTVGGFTVDVGALQYYYPGARADDAAGRKTGQRFDTLEAYAGVGYGVVSFKLWATLTDYFGLEDSKGSLYYDLGGSFPVNEKLNVLVHLGYQDVRRTSSADYLDYRIGLTYDLHGWALGAALVGVLDRDDTYDKVGDPTVVVSVSRTF